VETLDNEPAEEAWEAAWDEEIKREWTTFARTSENHSGEQVLRELAEEFPDGE